MKIKMVCKECGSDNLYFNGNMVWDVKKQDYIMDDIFNTNCGDCGFVGTSSNDVEEVVIKVGK